MLIHTIKTASQASCESSGTVATESERKQAEKKLSDLRLMNRSHIVLELWCSVEPGKVKQPLAMHVAIFEKPSIFMLEQAPTKGYSNSSSQVERRASYFRYYEPEQRNRFLPKSAGRLVKMLEGTVQEMTDIEHQSVAICSGSTISKLLKFMWEVAGTRQQRLLLATSYCLGFLNSLVASLQQHYEQSVLINTIASVAGKPGDSSSVGLVVLRLGLLRTWSTLMKRLEWKLEAAAFNGMRKSLSDRLTHQVLSQDIEEVADEDGDDWEVGTFPQNEHLSEMVVLSEVGMSDLPTSV